MSLNGYQLILKPAAGNWRTPPEQRLRAALKALLRGYGLRCTDCRPVPPRTTISPATKAAATNQQPRSEL